MSFWQRHPIVTFFFMTFAISWAIWLPGNFHQTIPLGLFLLQSVALAIIYTWLHNRTKGSLLIAHLFHAASNLTLGVLPVLPTDTGGELTPLWLTVGLLALFTIAVATLSTRLSASPAELHVANQRQR